MKPIKLKKKKRIIKTSVFKKDSVFQSNLRSLKKETNYYKDSKDNKSPALSKFLSNYKKDGIYKNAVTKLGTSLDPTSLSYLYTAHRDDQRMSDFYTSNDIAKLIVDIVPERALEKRLKPLKNSKIKEISSYDFILNKFDIFSVLTEAITFSRIFGGSVIYKVSSSADPSEPLNEQEEIINYVALSPQEIFIYTTDIETRFSSPNFNKPTYYNVMMSVGANFHFFRIHHSRIIRFDGELVTKRRFRENNYWNDSTLLKLSEPIEQYCMAHLSSSSTIQQFNQNILKIKNLNQLVSSPAGLKTLTKRSEAIRNAQSVNNLILLDENDEYITSSKPVSGLSEMIRSTTDRLVTASKIPHTILLGESPTGSSATGNSTVESFYSSLRSFQVNFIKPTIENILHDHLDEDLEFDFESLYDQTDIEKSVSKLNKVTAQEKLFLMGATTAEEIKKENSEA